MRRGSRELICYLDSNRSALRIAGNRSLRIVCRRIFNVMREVTKETQPLHSAHIPLIEICQLIDSLAPSAKVAEQTV